MQLKGELEKGGAKMAIENDIADDRPKVYLETSFMFYLTGRETSIITPRSYLEDFSNAR